MARTTELAPTTTDGTTSTGFLVAAGASVVVGIYVASGDIPSEARLDILVETPGADLLLKSLSRESPLTVLTGPVTKYKLRMATNGRENVAVGGFLEA